MFIRSHFLIYLPILSQKLLTISKLSNRVLPTCSSCSFSSNASDSAIFLNPLCLAILNKIQLRITPKRSIWMTQKMIPWWVVQPISNKEQIQLNVKPIKKEFEAPSIWTLIWTSKRKTSVLQRSVNKFQEMEMLSRKLVQKHSWFYEKNLSFQKSRYHTLERLIERPQQTNAENLYAKLTT